MDAEHDLRVRAHVHDELHALAALRLLRQDDAGRVGADVAGDARQDVDAGARMGPHADLGRVHLQRLVGGQRERRRAERHGVQAQQQVVHDRVAHDGQLEDVAGRHARPGRQGCHQLAHGRPHGAGHRGRPVGMQHGVRDAAHEVLAEPDLWVHDALGGEHCAVRQVDEVAGDGRRAHVKGDAHGALVEARPDRGDDARRRGPPPSPRTSPPRAPPAGRG